MGPLALSINVNVHLLQVLNLLCKLTNQVTVKCPDGVIEEIIEYTLSMMYVFNIIILYSLYSHSLVSIYA